MRRDREAMIEFRHVSKIYLQGQRRVAALNDLSLTIEPGEFVVVMGPSGSGKSSFLHLAGGLDVPTEGETIIDGRDIRKMGDEELTLFRRNHIGLVFQFFNLMPTLSVLENTALPALLSGGKFADVRPRAERLLTQVGLKERITHRPEELSGGEMQRVAIARALINDPPILLADEPTGNLDPDTSTGIVELLSHINQSGTTILVATHDTAIVDRMQKRVLGFEKGRLVRDEQDAAYRLKAPEEPMESAELLEPRPIIVESDRSQPLTPAIGGMDRAKLDAETAR